MISASIEVKGPQRDLHSGNEGGTTVRFQAMYCFELHSIKAFLHVYEDSLQGGESSNKTITASQKLLIFIWICQKRQVAIAETNSSPCAGCVGVFNEPLSDLTKILASLVDKSNRICIPGFLDRVRPNTLAPALSRLDSSAEFSLSGYREALGVPQLVRGSPHAIVCSGMPDEQCSIAVAFFLSFLPSGIAVAHQQRVSLNLAEPGSLCKGFGRRCEQQAPASCCARGGVSPRCRW